MYVIIGLGKTGLSVARFLKRQQLAFCVADTRQNPPELNHFKQEFPDIELYLGKLPVAKMASAPAVILSPGLSRTQTELQQIIAEGIPVIGDIELFVQHAKAPIIAITGTNAKGTVTTMTGAILTAAGKKVLLGGNIGTPALDLLLKATPDFYVMELSSFQLESTFSLNAIAATILNVTPDHLDYHGTMTEYLAAKQRIYCNAQNGIYNRDDIATLPQAKTKLWSFGLSRPTQDQEFGLVSQNEQMYLMHGNEPILSVDELAVFGQHNWLNALAACALATTAGADKIALQQGLRNFRGLPHRCELIIEKNGIRWINDSKGTNVGATQAALAGIGPTIKGKIVLLAGGLAKGQDFSPLKSLCQDYVKDLILFGQDADIIAKALGDVIKTHHVKTLAEAVNAANMLVQAGDVVLLSPICASLDMFKNYEDRGEQFITLVKKTL